MFEFNVEHFCGVGGKTRACLKLGEGLHCEWYMTIVFVLSIIVFGLSDNNAIHQTGTIARMKFHVQVNSRTFPWSGRIILKHASNKRVGLG